jgi:purine-binding chemotaxis protein CheW
MDLANIRKKLKEAKDKEKAGAAKANEASEASATAAGPNTKPEIPQQFKPPKEQETTISERTEEAPAEESAGGAAIAEETASAPEAPAPPKEDPLHREIHEEIVKEFEGTSPERAGEAPPVIAPEGIMELLAFRLCKEDYAFRVSDIEEVIKPQRITPVPRVDSFVIGVSSLRGKILPLVDLKKRLSITGQPDAGAKPRMIILNGPKGSIGVWVDSVADVLRIPESLVHEPPAHLSEGEARYIEGTALWEGRFISIIRAGEVLNITKEVQTTAR